MKAISISGKENLAIMFKIQRESISLEEVAFKDARRSIAAFRNYYPENDCDRKSARDTLVRGDRRRDRRIPK